MPGSPHKLAQPVTRCIFCGSPNLTDEHVFSRWTHRYMLPRRPGKALSRHGRLYLDRQDERFVKLPGETRDWQIKCVCGGTHETCNNGWMRRIEDQARPALIPLIKGEETRLSPSHQRAIAAWASVKSIVAEYGSDKGPITDRGRRRLLMRRQAPPDRGWAVWIGHLERRNWILEWANCAFLVSKKEHARVRPDQPPSHYNSNSSTQVIGKLFVQVVHSPMRDFVEGWRFPLPHGGSLFRIWPPSGVGINWPGEPLTDEAAEAVVNAIPTFLLIIKRGKV